MATPMPQSLNTHPPVVPLQRIEGDPDEVAFRDKTVQSCVKRYGNTAPPLTHDDVMCIWGNPWGFSDSMDAPVLRTAIRMHKNYSSLFLTSPTDEASGVADDKRKLAEEELKNPDPKRSKKDNKQPGKPPAKEKGQEPKKSDGRVTAAKNEASRRDHHMCCWQWTPDPDISHFFPYAATQDDESAAKTAEWFSITKNRFGVATYDKFRTLIATPGKLEVPANMQALGKSMHFWEDRGYLSFKASKPDVSANGIWFVTIQLCWLPYLHHEPNVSATADVTYNSSGNTVVRACSQLNDAYRLGYPPRDPPIGKGVMKAVFRDRTEITSGRSVKFQFKTKEEADFFTAMVNYHWFGMSILTFRGVTKGRKPDSGSGGGGGGGDSNTRARASTVPTLPTSSSAPTLPVGRGRGPGTNSPRGPGGGHTPTGSIARGPGNNSPRGPGGGHTPTGSIAPRDNDSPR